MTDEECLNMFCEFLPRKSVDGCGYTCVAGDYPCIVGPIDISPEYIIEADASQEGAPMLELYEKAQAIQFVRESYEKHRPEDGGEFRLSVDEFYEFNWS